MMEGNYAVHSIFVKSYLIVYCKRTTPANQLLCNALFLILKKKRACWEIKIGFLKICYRKYVAYTVLSNY